MRRISLVCLVVLLAIVPLAYAQGSPGNGAVDFLLASQNDDGSFGESVTDTTAAIIGLSAYGAPNPEAVEWLVNLDLSELTVAELSLVTIAAAATGQDLEAVGNGNLLEVLTGQLRAERNVGNLCLGLVGLSTSGVPLPPTAVAGTVAFQNEDGGFAMAPGEDSDPATTAVCVHALALTDEAEALEAALSFLSESQAEDGSWGDGAQTTLTVMIGQIAGGVDLRSEGGAATGYVVSQRNDDGAFLPTADAEPNVYTNALAAMVFRNLSFNSFVPEAEDGEAESSTEEAMASGEAPELDPTWDVVKEGFGMDELDSADDFLVTVVDPFNDDELFGVEIINWTASYEFTPFIVENFLPADVILWLADNQEDFYDTISDDTLNLLPAEVLEQLPEEVQARVSE